MASLRDVADKAGVSVGTVSKILNTGTDIDRISEQTIRRVRRAARELNYIPNYHARSLQLGLSETIGVVLEAGPDSKDILGVSYYGPLLGGLESRCREAEFDVIFIGPGRKTSALDRGLHYLQQRRIDALAIPGELLPEGERDLLTGLTDAIVLMEYFGETSLPVVRIDEQQGVQAAVEHLAGLRHRRIAWFCQNYDRANSQTSQARRTEAFETACRQHGLESLEFRVPVRTNSLTDVAEMESLRVSLREWLGGHGGDFTAAVCYNEMFAIAAYAALRDVGLSVPEDVSVVGFDNVFAPYLVPGLTSVGHMLPQTGRRAAELLLAMARDKSRIAEHENHVEVLAPDLVLRESTAPPKSS